MYSIFSNEYKKAMPHKLHILNGILCTHSTRQMWPIYYIERRPNNQGTSAIKKALHVPIDVIHTSAVILARQRVTFVNLDLAVCPSHAWDTLTRVAVDLVRARPVVETRVREAFVNIRLASVTYGSNIHPNTSFLVPTLCFSIIYQQTIVF